MRVTLSLSALLLSTLLYAESVDEAFAGFDDTTQASTPEKKTKNSEITDDLMDGFDDTPTAVKKDEPKDEMMEGFDDDSNSENQSINDNRVDESESDEESYVLVPGLTGKITQQIAMSYNSEKANPNIFSSLRSSLFLDYEHKFDNGVKIKVNARTFYDSMYDVRKSIYYPTEIDELRTETELFDAYVEWGITDNLDLKIGRQVIVWGRSDTIRITDILNPIDNRRPGIVDIEDLRLPTTMAKFDYSIGDWRITPIIILEQRFSKNPPIGSIYNPLTSQYKYYDEIPKPVANYINQFNFEEESYSDITYALSVGAEFQGWDVNFYAAHVYNDSGYLIKSDTTSIGALAHSKIRHDKVNMAGMALNVLSGPWLFKTELAYFDGIKYSLTNKEYKRLDGLIGFEYKGINDTTISYDYSMRHLTNFDNFLEKEPNFEEENTYQHAFRVSSDFVNATVHANYLISLFGGDANKGGFQRAWLKYDVADGVNTEFGVVDYLGGSRVFDLVKDEIILFTNISYNF